MGTKQILILIPLLIIFSYLFDAFSRKTKFPSVLLLLATGMLVRAIADWYGFAGSEILTELIAVLGTIGLILIVLEGALELQIKKESMGTLLSGFAAALIILVVNIWVVGQLISLFTEVSPSLSILLAVPLSIISSAVAIPSAAGLFQQDREFVVYESTFSDILGILIFNYTLGQYYKEEPLIAVAPLLQLGLQLLGIIILSLAIAFALFQLLKRITHHVKFFLILALLILLYALGKFLHLPALVTIFIFGLFLGNIKSLFPKFLSQYVNPEKIENDLHEFHILTGESTFLVRTFFFLFFGFSITLNTFMNIEPYFYGIIILAAMFAVRYFYFDLSRLRFQPSIRVYLSPRGLISILLFFQLQESQIPALQNQVIDEKVLLIIIIFSMLMMLLGTIRSGTHSDNPSELTITITNPDVQLPTTNESLNENDSNVSPPEK